MASYSEGSQCIVTSLQNFLERGLVLSANGIVNRFECFDCARQLTGLDDTHKCSTETDTGFEK